MSTYEIVIIIFLSMTFVLGLIKFMVYLIDIFLKKK
jgi:hypothetical protein